MSDEISNMQLINYQKPFYIKFHLITCSIKHNVSIRFDYSKSFTKFYYIALIQLSFDLKG